MPAHTFRQAALALLTANAIRPFATRNESAALASFAAGWPTGELAPHLLAAGVADTLISLRRGRTSTTGLLLAAGAAAGLVYLTARARSAGPRLTEVLGETGATLADDDGADRASLRTLARPFAMADKRVEVLRDIAYTEGGRRALLDIYRPEGVDVTDAPVLVQIHGGGWTIGTKEQQGLLLMNRMAARGWVCVAVNYRLAPKHPWPAQIIDVKRALAWVHEHIADYGGNPAYVAVTGGSAGGHLAALAALTSGTKEWQPGFEDVDTTVAACVPFYGVYDMAGDDGDPYTVGLRDGFLRGRGVFERAATLEEFRAASPLHRITPDAPDMFVLHGDSDTVVSVRQARAFVARLRQESSADVTYAEIPGAQHAFDVFGSIRAHHAVRAVQRWLERHHAAWAERPAA